MASGQQTSPRESEDEQSPQIHPNNKSMCEIKHTLLSVLNNQSPVDFTVENKFVSLWIIFENRKYFYFIFKRNSPKN